MSAPQGPDARRATTRSGTPSPAAPSPGAPSPGVPSPQDASAPTTVLPAGTRRPPPRPAAPRPVDAAVGRPANKPRRARLALKRIDPWSVFVFSLLASVFLGIALVVAVAALYAVVDRLGVLASVNELYSEVTGGDGTPLITSSRVVGGAAVLAAANVVLLTLLATLGALLHNLCASFTGGIELTLGERDG